MGGKANGLFCRLAKLFRMQAFLRRLMMNFKVEISKNYFFYRGDLTSLCYGH